MKIRTLTSIALMCVLMVGCATTNQPRVTQVTRVHKAPESHVIVAALETVSEPISEGFKAMGAIGSPVSAGLGNLLSALGAGLGSAVSIGASANSATTLTTVSGIEAVTIGSAKSEITSTDGENLASEAISVATEPNGDGTE